jgi:SAM-dependent methyltransferase
MPAALREIRRVLRPGGEARILVYNRRSFHYWLSQVLLEGIIHRRLLREGSMAGVLSANVERTSIGARPLVRVYSPPQVRRMLSEAGLIDVNTAVGGFNPEDTPITAVLARRSELFRRRSTLDTLGRLGGWYVLGRGRRP